MYYLYARSFKTKPHSLEDSTDCLVASQVIQFLTFLQLLIPLTLLFHIKLNLPNVIVCRDIIPVFGEGILHSSHHYKLKMIFRILYSVTVQITEYLYSDPNEKALFCIHLYTLGYHLIGSIYVVQWVAY